MGMGDVTAESVRQAMAEFDELGRDAFLEKYGFGRARDYFVINGDRRYDSKAIVGVAHRFVNGSPLKKDEFYGGEDHAAGHLESLGFAVTRPKDRPAGRRLGKQALIERIGARLTNVRWGWDATMPDGSIVFIGWTYNAAMTEGGEVERCLIFNYGNAVNERPGGKERARHIEEVFAADAAAYLVLATPKDRDVHPHEIERIDERLYSVRLERDGAYVFARVVGADSAPDVRGDDLTADIRAIEAAADIPETEKAQLVHARRGQGIFRARLELFERACRVTGTQDRAHLRASHIKPWRDSTNAERLDGANGLLLAPHVDHLFDRGFMSFEDDGRFLVSVRLEPNILSAWAIERDLNVGPFTKRQCVYLAYHRASVFLRDT